MLTGPGGVDEGDVGDGLVFVSHSHVDAVWAQRFGGCTTSGAAAH